MVPADTGFNQSPCQFMYSTLPSSSIHADAARSANKGNTLDAVDEDAIETENVASNMQQIQTIPVINDQ